MRTWNMTPKRWIGIASLLLLILWWGVPSFNKWRADRLVDELCAKDGGIKVYETVTLSKDRFSKFNEIYVSQKKDWKSPEEYYSTSETTWIIPEGRKFGELDMWRYHDRLFRASDNKILAEGIGYSRRGGDAIGRVHPSHYTCSISADIKYVNQKTFIHN